MSNHRPTRTSRPVSPVTTVVDELADEPIALIVVLLGAMVVVPALLVTFWAKAVTWALEHALLVPAAEASLTIPNTHAGLDGRRIALAVLLIIAAGAGAIAMRRQQRIREAKIRAQKGQP